MFVLEMYSSDMGLLAQFILHEEIKKGLLATYLLTYLLTHSLTHSMVQDII
jgi:hypothetical protein